MTPTREQLELAAKAAGLMMTDYSETQGARLITGFGMRWWNPVTDKSDSRDLEVACEIELRYGLHGVWATTKHRTIEIEVQFYADYNNDKGLATCAAVLLCAVELGKTLVNGRAM